MKPTISVIATPIGNLEDLSPRAARILAEADLILAEDTRVTRILLFVHNIKRQAIASLHEHSSEHDILRYIDALRAGQHIALVTDAGTPAIADPGAYFLDRAYEAIPELTVTPIPGPSAITAALSVSGFFADRFLFLGFVPQKKGREGFFKELAKAKETVIFFESPHRIEKTLKALAVHIDTDQRILIARELTKKFETLARGAVKDVLAKVRNQPMKGEFVLVLEKQRKKR